MMIAERLVEQGLTTEQAEKVANNFGKVIDGLYVSKERFNEINSELKSSKEAIKQRDDQLEALADDGEIDGLKETIERLQKENKEATKIAGENLIKERKTNAIKLALNGKVHNIDLTLGQIKLDEIVMNNDGSVKSGLKEQIDVLKESNNFLFIPEKTEADNTNNNSFIKGATPKDGDKGTNVKLTPQESFVKGLAENSIKSANNDAMSHYFQ